MKRKVAALIATTLVFTTLLTGCAGNVSYDKDEVTARANEIINYFIEDDLSAVYDTMAQSMKEYTTVEDLENSWLDAHEILGDFVRISGSSIFPEDDSILVIYSVKFDVSSVEFQLAFSEELELVSLYIK